MGEITLREIMMRMPEAFQPEKAGDARAIVQFHFTGTQAANWQVRIADGRCETEEGNHPSPDMTMTVDGADYVRLITGDLSPVSAFMQGKIQLKGDMSLAMKLTSFFERPE